MFESALRVGYLVNLYPAVSHTFIGREIRALEGMGVRVYRYALRPGAKTFVDRDDAVEQKLTKFVVASGALNLLSASLQCLIAHPGAFLRAAKAAFQIGWRSDRGIALYLIYLLEACVVARWARHDRVQHLHAHFGTNSAAIAMLVKLLSGIPYSFTAHGAEVFDNAAILHLDAKVALSEFAVCVSQFGRSHLMRWSNPDQWWKIQLIHCGVDEKFLAVTPPAIVNTTKLTCVGRLDVEKAQLVLVAAMRRLRDEGVKVEVSLLGDGPLRPRIEQAIAAAELQDVVKLLGWASGDQVRLEIDSSCALVLPSFAENLPVVFMEAMALGRPVVSTYVGGIPELVKPGETGWLAPAGDDAALADAIRAIVQTPPERLTAMGAAGRSRVLRDHNSVKEAAKLKDLFVASAKRASEARRR